MFAVQLRVVRALQTAQAFVIGADIAEHMRCQVAIRVEALELLLQIDALQVQLTDALRRVCIHAACDPREVTRIVQPRQDRVVGREVIERVLMNDLGEQRGIVRLVACKLFRHGIDAVYKHRRRQFAQVAVIEHAAARGHFKAALLLHRGDVDKLRVTPDLQPSQAKADGQCPQDERAAHHSKAPALHRGGQRLRGHWFHLLFCLLAVWR
jgi:hypothetical protein